jgi:hypothetical protein
MKQKSEITKRLLPDNATQAEITEFMVQWWQDPRDQDSGLWLTLNGFMALSAAGIKSYQIKFDEEFFMSNQLAIWLSRYMSCPFYITRKEIYVFSENMAIQLVLFSGNIERFIRAKVNKLKS